MTDAPFHESQPGAPLTASASDRATGQGIWALGRLVLIAVGLFLLAGLFGRMMDYGIRRDEMMFVSPAVLLDEAALYVDFFYNHLPYSAWLFHAADGLFGDAGLLFSARLVVFGGWLLLLAGTAWAVYRLSRSEILTAFCLTALLTNETLLNQTGMAASNNLLPLAFAVLAMGLFLVEIVEDRPRALPLFVSGLCLSIATGMKISAVVFIPPFAIAAFLLPQSLPLRARLSQVVLPLLAGGLVGAVPLFWLLMTLPETFLAHVIGFHTGPHVAYWEAFRATEPGLAMGLGGKLLLAYEVWLSGSALLLVLGVLVCAAVALGRVPARLRSGSVLLMLAVIAMGVAMAFVPTPGFPQYFAMPLVSLPLLAALLVRPASAGTARAVPMVRVSGVLTPVLGSAMLLMVVLAFPRLAPGLLVLTNPGNSEVTRFDRGGAELRAVLSQNGVADGPVATLMPLYPLEEGLPVYPAFATGQFAYRVEPFTADALARHYVMVGAGELSDMFDAEPPAAFLLGYEPALEVPLRAYADANGYAPITAESLNNRYGAGVLLVPQGEVKK